MPDFQVSTDIDAFMQALNDAAARGELALGALATVTPGTGVATALAVNIGSAGAPILFNGAAGTPSSLVGTNITGTAAGLTAGAASAVAVGGITGLGTGVATFLATPSSANLAAAVTGETGTGALVFGSSPTIDAPTLTGTTTAATVNATTGNVTTFRVLDAVDQSHGMQFVIASDLTANRTLTLTTGDANRAITLTGDLTMSGAFNLTLTVTGNTNITFPTSGTLLTTTGSGASLTALAPANMAAGVLGANITLGEGAGQIALDTALSADGTYSGIVMVGTAGYTQAFGDVVYLDPTDSRWEACDANSAAGADGDCRGTVGMVVSAGTDGTACTILLRGKIRADAKFPTFTVNNPIYISETAAAVTQTQPTTTDVVIRILGAALTADEMLFMPDNMWITHT